MDGGMDGWIDGYGGADRGTKGKPPRWCLVYQFLVDEVKCIKNGWMDGQIDWWTDERMDGWNNWGWERAESRTRENNVQLSSFWFMWCALRIDGWMFSRMDGWSAGKLDGWIDRWMGGGTKCRTEKNQQNDCQFTSFRLMCHVWIMDGLADGWRDSKLEEEIEKNLSIYSVFQFLVNVMCTKNWWMYRWKDG